MASSSCSNHQQKLVPNLPPESKYHDMLLDIKKNYESIFSWEIDDLTKKQRNKLPNILECVTQKEEILFENKNTFDINGMCLRLIICYEVFLNGDVSKALITINDLIQTLQCTKKDTFFNQISNACFHITHATQAYIMAFLDNDVEQVLKNIKLFSSFDNVEKSAVYAIKSRTFVEYSPENNLLAVKFAETARNFNYTELYWITIWLKATGRKRRFDRIHAFPLRDELEAANKLSSQNDNPEYFLSAAKVFSEAGFVLRFSKTKSKAKESNQYFKSSAKLIMKAYNLASNNCYWLYRCLLIYLDLPNFITKQKKEIIKSIVSRLSQIENKNKIYEILGLYYLKMAKDYKQAKTYMVMASSNGSFKNSLKLLKVECLLKSAKEFPVVEYLTSLYEKHDCPKRRLIIILQIIIYYMYVEKNPKQLLFYLDAYLNQDIDYVQKKQHLITMHSLYISKSFFNYKTLFYELVSEIKCLNANPHWSEDDKKTMDNVKFKFDVTFYTKRTETDIDIPCIGCCEIYKATVVIRPCLHQCFCDKCYFDHIKLSKHCPLCRSLISDPILKVPIVEVCK